MRSANPNTTGGIKKNMNGDDLDRAIHECMGVIWKAYRESVSCGDFSAFNGCFNGLYAKYDDVAIQKFIGWMGLALVPAATRRIRGASDGC